MIRPHVSCVESRSITGPRHQRLCRQKDESTTYQPANKVYSREVNKNAKRVTFDPIMLVCLLNTSQPMNTASILLISLTKFQRACHVSAITADPFHLP